MDTIEILEKNECCGCGSCSQKCPKKAIKMVENAEGFLFPFIDKKKCINCGLCSKVCPQLKLNGKKERNPKAYAIYCKNRDYLNNSSSGGVFSVLAEYILNNNGVVVGAAYDDNFSVNHIIIQEIENLDLLRRSKYVQSNTGNTYREVELLLKKNVLVLYVGTPCQIAGLNSFLIKEYDNLLTVDFVCHGVPSQKIFQKYINYLSKKYKSKVIKYNFRSKEAKGWSLVSKVETENKKIKYLESYLDPYYSNFIKGTIYRESCYNCHYANCNRGSNITMGDYFAIKKINPNFYNRDGVSLILINDSKGEKAFKKIKEKVEYVETDINFAINTNRNLKESSTRPSVRDSIYNNINDVDDVVFFEKKLKVKKNIKRLIQSFIPFKIKKKLRK